jgi:NCS1 family nucleobase:cation symporter-1
MYLGHYLAWICAGIMGAALMKITGLQELNPGKMADYAAGWAGILAVLVAGWTTANPTIYRAGLALQIVTPNWARWKVTLVAGAITTVVGCFPAIFMQLLNFVAIYGLCLMPIGAVIVAEHWLFPRIGLRRYWTEKRGLVLNPPALIAWVTVLVLCFPIEMFSTRISSPMQIWGVHLFFRWLPGWFIAAGLYTAICYGNASLFGARASAEERALDRSKVAGPAAPPVPAGAPPISPAMWLAGAVALVALVMCVVLPLMVFLGGSVEDVYTANLERYKTNLLIVTIIYFAAAIYWFTQREKRRGTA